jgi:hypothetical protein
MGTPGFEAELQGSGFIFALKSHGVIVVCDFENFGHIFNGEAESERLVAGVAGEGLLLDEERDQGNVTAVHGLNGEALGVHLDVDHLHKVLDGVNDLSEERAFLKSCLKHSYSGKILLNQNLSTQIHSHTDIFIIDTL